MSTTKGCLSHVPTALDPKLCNRTRGGQFNYLTGAVVGGYRCTKRAKHSGNVHHDSQRGHRWAA